MDTEERVKRQKELIEELGRYFDKQGLQPIAGRIMGLFMVMDKEQFTFEEVVEELQISKSSASNALRNLEIRDAIEYITLPGDRKRYFQIRRQDKFSLIEDFTQQMKYLNEMNKKVLELKVDKNSRNALFIRDIQEMLDFFLKNIEELKEKFNG